MAHGGTEKYYNPANKVVNDGDTAFAGNLNDINYAVDTALAQVADDLDVMDVKATTLSAEAESWAHNDQGIPPDPLEPTEFSSKAYAVEAREYAIQAKGVPIHKADGTTQLIDSAYVSATKAAASQVDALASKNAAALSESNAEAYSLQAWADQQVGFESMQDAQAAASAAAASAANLPNATTAGANKILVTNSTGNGWEYPAITAAGKALLDDASATAQKATLGLGSVDNTSDVDKPISTLAQAALNLKADKSLFTGGTGYRYINGTLVQAATAVSTTSTPTITFPVAFPNSVTCIVFAVADFPPGDLRISGPASDLTKVGFIRTGSTAMRINIIAWGY